MDSVVIAVGICCVVVAFQRRGQVIGGKPLAGDLVYLAIQRCVDVVLRLCPEAAYPVCVWFVAA